MTAHKRQSDADKSRWVVSSYFESQWMGESGKKAQLPVVLDMAALYHSFLKRIIPIPLREGETLENLVLRVDELRIKELETAKLELQINKEKHFNRRVDLNRMVNKLKQEIDNLIV